MRKTKFMALMLCLCLAVVVVYVSACNGDSGGDETPIYTVRVTNGTGAGRYYEGDYVKVVADKPEGKQFLYWYNGVDQVSASAEYIFAVEKNTSLVAMYSDKVSDVDETVYTVEIPMEKSYFGLVETDNAGFGGGSYKAGSSCTVKLYDKDMGRTFLGWAELTGEDELGEIITNEKQYTFTVDSDKKFVPVFNPAIEQIETIPSQGAIQWNKSNSYFEFDRNQPESSMFNVADLDSKKLLGVKYYVYDNEDCTIGSELGTFTLEPKIMTVPGFESFGDQYFGANVNHADGKLGFVAIGSMGNYYCPNAGLITPFLQEVVSNAPVDVYYFRAQLIGSGTEIVIGEQSYVFLPGEMSAPMAKPYS